jgi:hypothetical protein
MTEKFMRRYKIKNPVLRLLSREINSIQKCYCADCYCKLMKWIEETDKKLENKK